MFKWIGLTILLLLSPVTMFPMLPDIPPERIDSRDDFLLFSLFSDDRKKTKKEVGAGWIKEGGGVPPTT